MLLNIQEVSKVLIGRMKMWHGWMREKCVAFMNLVPAYQFRNFAA